MLLWCPQKNVAVATVVNVAEEGYPLAEAICNTVLPQVFGIKKPIAPTPETVTAVPTDLSPFVGRYESFGMIQNINLEGERLKLTATMAVAPQMEVSGCELIPLGEGRFLPRDRRASANRNWDMAFWGRDADGRATHLLQGIFPLRRVS